MFTPAATAARIASEPEWWNVPSPRFWTKCAVVGERREADPLRALAAHLGACRRAGRGARRRRARSSCGSRCPTPTSVVGGARWRCCAGSPSRSTACAAARSHRRRRRDGRASSWPGARGPARGKRVGAEQAAERAGDVVGAERCRATGISGTPCASCSPTTSGASGRAVERLLELRSRGTAACPRRRAPSPRRPVSRRHSSSRSSGHGMPSRDQPNARARSSSRLVEPEVVQRAQRPRLIARCRRRRSPARAPAGLERDPVEAGDARVLRGPGRACGSSGRARRPALAGRTAAPAAEPRLARRQARGSPSQPAARSTVADGVGDVGDDLQAGPQAGCARDRATACRPKLEISAPSRARAAASTGSGTSARRSWARVEDLLPGSSPIQRDRAAERRGAGQVAVADRVGGPVEARVLAVPEAGHAVVAAASSSPSSCVPATAVAASSSLRPGPEDHAGRGRGGRAARPISMSRPPSGEPW